MSFLFYTFLFLVETMAEYGWTTKVDYVAGVILDVSKDVLMFFYGHIGIQLKATHIN